MTLQEVHQLVRQLISGSRFGEAEHVCRQVLAQKPDEETTRNLLGSILIQTAIMDACQGKFGAAEKKLMEAAQFKPNDPSVHNNLGGLRISQRRPEEAIGPLQRALELQPDYVDGLSNLGLAYLELSRPEESIAMYERAVKVAEGILPANPVEMATTRFMLGNACRMFGRLDEAIAEYRKTLKINPNLGEAWTALLYTMNLHDGFTTGEIFEAHCGYGRQFETGKKRPASGAAKRGRVRVGFVSADFKEHAISHFFPAVFELDRSRFEIYCYASVSQPDEVTDRLKKRCDGWRDIGAMNDADAASLIERDQIDVLIDLSGHTSANRLRIFTHRPAPLQMSWLGYPNTTGLSCIDFRVTDSFADPPGQTEHLHSEKLWRLDPCFLCYQPIEDAPEVSESPSTKGGPITFGSFNDFAKIRPVTVALWASVLRAVPDSRLMLKARQLASQWARDGLIAAFEREGVAADRLILLGRDPSIREHLEKYSQIDIALDTYPYHGTTTSCDALWMGVPVISLAGKTHVSRVGMSLLHVVGLPELAVDSQEEFVGAAAELARDSTRLREVRLSLRNRMKNSALGDPKGFAQRFGEMLIGVIQGVQRM
ncbi:MAG TPA: tetratricopeptide repeat protein [Tepidisphaeraceae bacterium]|nr:tetratricopeptide repeat protein [Tepidisphaeraceae bacterium]